MSRTTDADADESRPVRLVRTVTPGYRGRPDVEMDAIGWSIFLGLVVLLVPLLPVLVVGWLVVKLLEFGRRRVV